MTGAPRPERLRVVLVSGLSGGGKSSVLRALEDIGYEAVDNPPLPMIEEVVRRSDRRLAIGVDARTRGFDGPSVLAAIERLRADPRLLPELVYVWADETVLLRRYSETRRRHPLAPGGGVQEGIAREAELTAPLRAAAALVLDTSDLPLAAMRILIERQFGLGSAEMAVSLVSFAYPHGLPRDADLVFDARFLRNPHYDTILRPRTGLDADVASYVEQDPDFRPFLSMVEGLIDLLLPRFVREGKKYVTIAVGCTGGRHRSVHVVECLAAHLARRTAAGAEEAGWLLHVSHRELARDGQAGLHQVDRPVAHRGDGSFSDYGGGARPSSRQAQEA
jgi:RNase adapter protein RapZ